MPMPLPPQASRGKPTDSPSTSEPAHLWRQVVHARGVVTSQRHLPVRGSFAAARGDLLSALEAYADSLAANGRPIPYALRDELRLNRLTCTADRYQGYDPGDRRR
ncbi:MAG: hypothetical protein JWN22_2416 [Nocardioides sp.]|jgi:hypothetical protein|nr:hypothetical protein [Nocardioides sp.]